MVWTSVTSCGKKGPLIFVEPGVKIDQHHYLEMLSTKVKPWLDKQDWPASGYKFEQDSAPSHAATRVQDWMDQNLIGFWPKQFWPPKSPDLNPMDYSIWSALEKAVNVRAHPNLVSLKKSIRQAWNDLGSDYIRDVCSSARKRFQAVVEAKGGHIEKY